MLSCGRHGSCPRPRRHAHGRPARGRRRAISGLLWPHRVQRGVFLRPPSWAQVGGLPVPRPGGGRRRRRRPEAPHQRLALCAGDHGYRGLVQHIAGASRREPAGVEVAPHDARQGRGAGYGAVEHHRRGRGRRAHPGMRHLQPPHLRGRLVRALHPRQGDHRGLGGRLASFPPHVHETLQVGRRRVKVGGTPAQPRPGLTQHHTPANLLQASLRPDTGGQPAG
jgi:hypothetical protein